MEGSDDQARHGGGQDPAGPARSATGPRTARPTNIMAQYAATATPAAAGDRARPEVRKTQPQIPVVASMPHSTAVKSNVARTTGGSFA